MKPIDADVLKETYPARRSLQNALAQAKPLNISSILLNVKQEMCENYCKIPCQYTKEEWEDLLENGVDIPCEHCPLNLL